MRVTHRQPPRLPARAAIVACLLFAQAALDRHELRVSIHGSGDLCLICLAGADLHHGEVSTMVVIAPSFIPILTGIQYEWSYLPVTAAPFRPRGPPPHAI